MSRGAPRVLRRARSSGKTAGEGQGGQAFFEMLAHPVRNGFLVGVGVCVGLGRATARPRGMGGSVFKLFRDNFF